MNLQVQRLCRRRRVTGVNTEIVVRGVRPSQHYEISTESLVFGYLLIDNKRCKPCYEYAQSLKMGRSDSLSR